MEETRLKADAGAEILPPIIESKEIDDFGERFQMGWSWKEKVFMYMEMGLELSSVTDGLGLFKKLERIHSLHNSSDTVVDKSFC